MDAFQLLRIKHKSIEYAAYPFWIKEKVGDNFIMRYLNKAYEVFFLKANGFRNEDYLNNEDLSVWPQQIADAFRLNDIECYNTKGQTKFKEQYNEGRILKDRYFIKQYIKDDETDKEYIVGFCLDL